MSDTRYKQEIGAEDINFFEGGSDLQTFTRRTTTGGELTLKKIGAGGYREGSTYYCGSVADIEAAKESRAEIIELVAPIAPVANLTITKIFLPRPGAIITPASGVSVTINKIHKGVGAYQWFSIASGGSLVFSDGALDDAAYAEWVGAEGDCVLNGTTGAVESGTDDTAAIQAIADSGATSIELVTGKAYRITSAITITKNGLDFSAKSRGGTNDPVTAGRLVYDGPDAGYHIVIGDAVTTTAIAPVTIKNIWFDGQNKTIYAIYSNRTNALSEISNNYFWRTNGMLRAKDCWYLDVRDNHYRNHATIGATTALSAAFAELHNGIVQMNAANSCRFEGNAITYANITIDGAQQDYAMRSNRQETFHLHMNTFERVHVANGLIYLNNTSVGNNCEISHLYLEGVTAEAVLWSSTYNVYGADVDHVHMLNTFVKYFILSGSADASPHFSCRRIYTIGPTSMYRFAYAGAGTAKLSVTVEDSLIFPGRAYYDTDHYVIKPYGGQVVTIDGGSYTSWDNRLGLPLSGVDHKNPYSGIYVQYGLATTYTGVEDTDWDTACPYIDISLDGLNIQINGVGHWLSKYYNNPYRLRFYPTKNADTRLWQIRLGSHGNLFLYDTTSGAITNNASSTPLVNFNMAADDTVNAASIDTTVRRPPGAWMNYTNVITGSPSDPTAGTTRWNTVGDVWIDTNMSNTYGIIGKVCIASGKPGTWRAFGALGGPTGDRPTLTANDIGVVYWDTGIGKAVFWSGSAWKLADGSAP